jgi:hypothetical protein
MAKTVIAALGARRSARLVTSRRSRNGSNAASNQGPPEKDQAAPSDLTVNELLAAYFRFAVGHYVKDGKPTGEATNIRYAIRHCRELFGKTLAKDFGPLRLKRLREHIADTPSTKPNADGSTRYLCRNEVNRRIRIIVRAFKWAVGEELISPTVHQALAAVPGLAKGRSAVREPNPWGQSPMPTLTPCCPG